PVNNTFVTVHCIADFDTVSKDLPRSEKWPLKTDRGSRVPNSDWRGQCSWVRIPYEAVATLIPQQSADFQRDYVSRRQLPSYVEIVRLPAHGAGRIGCVDLPRLRFRADGCLPARYSSGRLAVLPTQVLC